MNHLTERRKPRRGSVLSQREREQARLTALRMVSHRCESRAAGRPACLSSDGDWSKPKCPRCTAYLLATAVVRLLDELEALRVHPPPAARDNTNRRPHERR